MNTKDMTRLCMRIDLDRRRRRIELSSRGASSIAAASSTSSVPFRSTREHGNRDSSNCYKKNVKR